MTHKFHYWQKKQVILIILAHPDDPEFFCGGSVARWIREGNEVHYWLFTRGEKGCDPQVQGCEEIASTREKEQRAAALSLGVSSVHFGNFPDGELQLSLECRLEVVKAIREIQPGILVTCDPDNRFHRKNAVNHPDHIYAGANVIDSVYPAANNSLYFPELIASRLLPFQIDELWMSFTQRPNVRIDITREISMKIGALHKHVSQVGEDTRELDAKILSRFTRNWLGQKKYYERFHRTVFR